jgi:hypothetical protein
VLNKETSQIRKELHTMIEDNFIEGPVPFVIDFKIVSELTFSRFYKKIKKMIEEDRYMVIKSKNYYIGDSIAKYQLHLVKVDERKIKKFI